MAMTLRLTPAEDETLTRLARSFRTSKNIAAATAIELVAARPNHTESVRSSMDRLLVRYADVMRRLAQD